MEGLPGVLSDESVHGLVSDLQGVSRHPRQLLGLGLQVAPGNSNLLSCYVARDANDLRALS